jgi:hypothetical protein
MALSSVLLGMAIGFGLTAAMSAVMLTAELQGQGVRTPAPLIGLLIFRNLDEYRRRTRAQSGRTGPLFWLYIVPINAALVCAIAGLALRATGS